MPIVKPTATGDNPVTPVPPGNSLVVDATGTCPQVGGSLPTQVKVRAYASPGFAIPASPPGDAVTATLAGGNHSWSASGVPTPAGDQVVNGPANSTLGVWYISAGGTASEAVSFHGLRLNPGGGGGGNGGSDN